MRIWTSMDDMLMDLPGGDVAKLGIRGKQELHEGHAYLVREAKKQCDFLVIWWCKSREIMQAGMKGLAVAPQDPMEQTFDDQMNFLMKAGADGVFVEDYAEVDVKKLLNYKEQTTSLVEDNYGFLPEWIKTPLHLLITLGEHQESLKWMPKTIRGYKDGIIDAAWRHYLANFKGRELILIPPLLSTESIPLSASSKIMEIVPGYKATALKLNEKRLTTTVKDLKAVFPEMVEADFYTAPTWLTAPDEITGIDIRWGFGQGHIWLINTGEVEYVSFSG